MRVAICANGIKVMRLAAVRIATSPVPPCPLWQALTIAASIGYATWRYGNSSAPHALGCVASTERRRSMGQALVKYT